jgi:hypothetical protein
VLRGKSSSSVFSRALRRPLRGLLRSPFPASPTTTASLCHAARYASGSLFRHRRETSDTSSCAPDCPVGRIASPFPASLQADCGHGQRSLRRASGMHLARALLSGLRCQERRLRVAGFPASWRLTIHSSRSRFAARLNSGVRRFPVLRGKSSNRGFSRTPQTATRTAPLPLSPLLQPKQPRSATPPATRAAHSFAIGERLRAHPRARPIARWAPSHPDFRRPSGRLRDWPAVASPSIRWAPHPRPFVLASVPRAALAGHGVSGIMAPNNSFKPKPLRGSA